jgi:hypothetical protein
MQWEPEEPEEPGLMETKNGSLKNPHQKQKRNFTSLAGIHCLMPSLRELLQFTTTTTPFQFFNKLIQWKTHSTLFGMAKKVKGQGCVLVGPSGTGKTVLAKTIASESIVSFFIGIVSQLTEFGGGAEARIRHIFEILRKAFSAIFFIDDLDLVARKRPLQASGDDQEQLQVFTEFLVNLDGFSFPIVVLGSTNWVDCLDKAFIRPGRVDKILQFMLPSQSVRIDVFKFHSFVLGQSQDSSRSGLWYFFGTWTESLSGADLQGILNASFLTNLEFQKRTQPFQRLPLLTEKHTLASLHQAFDRNCTSSTTESWADLTPLQISREAYSQPGLLRFKEQVTPFQLTLKPRIQTVRYQRIEKQILIQKTAFTNKQFLKAQIFQNLAHSRTKKAGTTHPAFGCTTFELEKATFFATSFFLSSETKGNPTPKTSPPQIAQQEHESNQLWGFHQNNFNFSYFFIDFFKVEKYRSRPLFFQFFQWGFLHSWLAKWKKTPGFMQFHIWRHYLTIWRTTCVLVTDLYFFVHSSNQTFIKRKLFHQNQWKTSFDETYQRIQSGDLYVLAYSTLCRSPRNPLLDQFI